MGRSKSKPRAQRKFAQGAFVPQQNQPSASSTPVVTRAFHRVINLSGPVTYNNSSAKDLLTVMSLEKIHLHLTLIPVVKLEYDQELEKKVERTVKKKVKIKKKRKEKCSTKYGLRSCSKQQNRCCSDSDSGENIPLSFLVSDNMETKTDDSCTPQLDQTLPAQPPASLPASNDTATKSLHAQNSSILSDSRSPIISSTIKTKRETRLAKRKVVSKVADNVAKKRRVKLAARKKNLASVLTMASDPVAPVQTTELTSNQTDSEIPVKTAAKSCAGCIPFKLPDGLVTRTKFNKIHCPSHLMNGLQELLSVPPGTYSYCKICKRCELLSKYERVLDMLPVSDDNEPDILEATPPDVYDFDSEDEGLKLLRRGRELVRNVLTTKRLPIWLSNLEMTLKKTMFQDANKLGTLQRNISLDKDDVTVNKIITRIDYLNQCLMEDKKELDAIKPKRKTKSLKKVVAPRGKRVTKITELNDDMPLLRALKRTRLKKLNTNLIHTSTESGYEITETAKSPQQGPSNTPTDSGSPPNNLKIKFFATSAGFYTTTAPEEDLSISPFDVKVEEDFSSSIRLYLESGRPLVGMPTFIFEPEVPAEVPPEGISSDQHIHLTPIEIAQLNTDKVEWCSKKVTSTVTSRLYSPPTLTVDSDSQTPDLEDINHLNVPVNKSPNCSGESFAYSEQNLVNEFTSVDKLTYRPTLEEFEDPIKYMQKIQHEASKYGICKIIPPKEFHVPCHLDDNSMFTTINQYLGRLYQRWGPTIREMTGIQVYLAKINPRERDHFIKCPMFDGVELDLVKLYNAVLEHGGIEELLAHRELWARIAQQLSLVSPRGKPDHKKLEKLYCKHVLPYESLTSNDRDSLLAMIDVLWKERYQSLTRRANRPLHYQKRMLGECESDDEEPPLDPSCETIRTTGKPCFDRLEECTAKGRTMNLTTYRRLASQIHAMRFPPGAEPTTEEIEDEYWKILSVGKEHLCVMSACIDTSVDKLGHTYHRDGPGGSHPWNLKRLGENPLNVLSFLGKTLSVTEPTMCLNQLYSTNCWHKDPHLLAWMDYMHEGTTKIWYAVSENDSGLFRETMEHLAPFAVQNKGIWLTSDTTMVPPGMLLAKDVKLQRIEQNPGEFIVVFPGAYASSIATGLSISESVYFENKEWVYSIDDIFRQMRADHEPGMFSNIVLLFRMARDPMASIDVMPFIHKSINDIVDNELKIRQEAAELNFEIIQVKPEGKGNRGPVSWPNQEECSICRAPLILSKTVRYNDHRLLVCLKHGIQLYKFAPAEDRGTPPPVTVLYGEHELTDILHFVWRRIIGDDVFQKEELVD